MHQRLVTALIKILLDRQPRLLQFINLTQDLSFVVRIVDLGGNRLHTSQPRIYGRQGPLLLGRQNLARVGSYLVGDDLSCFSRDQADRYQHYSKKNNETSF